MFACWVWYLADGEAHSGALVIALAISLLVPMVVFGAVEVHRHGRQ